jgi:carotenoid cleavage dioxygenase
VICQDGEGQVRWFAAEDCCVFHVGNAREDAEGRIVLDALRSPWTPSPGCGTTSQAGSARRTCRACSGLPHRWILDPVTGHASEQGTDDRLVEFPTLNDTHIGRPYRYQYAVAPHGIIKYDLQAGQNRSYDAGEGNAPGEAAFVPAANDDGKDAGWLLTIVIDPAGTSRLDVLDASTMTRAAHFTLPYRVPEGLHGNWLPDTNDEPGKGPDTDDRTVPDLAHEA